MSSPLRCSCGVETKTLKQLVEHQLKEHGAGERPYPLFEPDPVIGYDEDAYRTADL